MKIYNTMSRRKEELAPIREGEVSIYNCGPTVYNLIHLGNARQICVFDVLRRYLKYKGYKVTFIQNFTDVDDRIIKRANEEGISPKEYSEGKIAEYFTDARGLNVSDADMHPKVTENIDLIIDIINKLVEKGFAYVSDGDVYFEAEKFEEYGKLSHMPLEELKEGASERVDDTGGKKRSPVDFALWKAAKEGEPYWESPFGNGRPGWHIECSAMSGNYIGDTIDIHSGGADLIFPHHENEIAQSEAATGKPLANYWMHNGMLNIDNRKMSKSLNNFFLLREAAEEYGYEPVRFMLLGAHYRSPMNYTAELIESYKTSLERLYNCRESIDLAIENAGEAGGDDETVRVFEARLNQFKEALDDDLNTADAIAAMFDLTRDINSGISEMSKETLIKAAAAFDEMSGVLGLLYNKKEKGGIPEEIKELAKARAEARSLKNFKLADEIRDKILSLGYKIEETRQGIKITEID